MKKMIEWLKNNLPVICITLILGMTINTMAEVVVPSAGVSYSNSKTSETTVNGALDELFEAVKINEELVEIKNNISNLQTKIDNMYPVGSIYITEKNEDPSEVFGGTWERYGVGKTLLSTDETSGKIGGSNTVTLTTANLPSHSHTISHTHTTATNTITSSGAHTHSTTAKTLTEGYLTAELNGAHGHSTNGYLYESWRTGTLPAYTLSFITGGYNFSTTNLVGADAAPTGYTSTAEAHTHKVTGTIPSLSIASSGAHTHTVPNLSTSSISTTSSGNAGSGASFSVQNPYITVYMWKRID